MTLKIAALWLAMVAAFLPSGLLRAQDTQTRYLSGHDKDDAVPWDFFCNAGKRGNRWTTIPVPSNWELQGFGRFTYGNTYNQDVAGRPPAVVEGHYRRRFPVPAAWTSRRVFLVFEGVMTDTRVQVNGQSAGPPHRGGYYRFQYEVSRLLKFGQNNRLDVTVDDESSNASINSAERRGDYWNYAGIYRPVTLEAVPTEFIQRVAVDGRADGSLTVDAFGDGVARADRVEVRVQDLQGHPVGAPFTQPISAGSTTVRLQTHIPSPRLWTAETPNLYQVEVRLEHGSTVLHRIHQRFGFRTIELRPGDGIYVNGRRILLKGSNRHSFWPDSGRCTSEKISRDDIRLMKDMNMNAVRMSHYPPDRHFLDDCDQMGLYVLDELGGWQHAYDTETGHRLVREMVVRDVNHPSVLFWDNANEGGWNKALDDDFARWDPQQRHVIHPGGGTFRDLNDTHYPSYSRIQQFSAGSTVFMPTEFLHGLYDGGAGSGLADYWEVMRQSKVAGGGFIWAFLDEAVKRVDLDGHLDTRGSLAPDGIVGPYREKEGSYDAIKQVWSPLVIPESTLPPDFDGTLPLQNRYDFTDARQCRFTWQLRKFRRPNDADSGFLAMSQGKALPSAPIPPGAAGTLRLTLPENWRQAEALSVRADDPAGREVYTWVWPLPHSADYRTVTAARDIGKATATETAGRIMVQSGRLRVVFDKGTGQLVSVERAGRPFSLRNGPRLAIGQAARPAGSDAPPKMEGHSDGPDYVVNATDTSGLKSVQWRVRGNGWIQLDYSYSLDGPQDFFGVGFDYPEADVKSMKWLGDGPYRVWKNRLAGQTLGVWENTYNDTITGNTLWQYPEFKGYYAGVRWVQFQTTEGPITAVTGQDDLYLQVLSPKSPPTREARNTAPPFPETGISFLHAIPPMGSKFAKADSSGPQGQTNIAAGTYHGSVSFFFGPLAQ